MLSACLSASACTTVGDPTATSLEDSVPGSRAGMVALAESGQPSALSSAPIVALPEGAGSVSKTRSKAYVNGLRQDISLNGSASGSIRNGVVVIVRTSKQETLDQGVPLYKPTESTIRSEIGAQFPKLSMRVSEREFSNNYGPYGLALGRAGGDVHCLYMWQWIDENRIPANAGVMGPMSVRVRLCQDKTTFDALKAFVDNLSIGVPTEGATSGGLPMTVSSREVPILPLATDTAEQPPAPKAHRSVHRRKPAAEARKASAAAQSPMPQVVIAAPTAAQNAPASGLVPKSSVDLPPQAYLGPKGSAATQPTNRGTPDKSAR